MTQFDDDLNNLSDGEFSEKYHPSGAVIGIAFRALIWAVVFAAIVYAVVSIANGELR